jgi:hypothetical protein
MSVDNISTIFFIDSSEILALVHLIFTARLQGTADANATLQHCQRQCFSLAGNPKDDENTPWLWQMPGGVYFGCVAALCYIISSAFAIGRASVDDFTLLNCGGDQVRVVWWLRKLRSFTAHQLQEVEHLLRATTRSSCLENLWPHATDKPTTK